MGTFEGKGEGDPSIFEFKKKENNFLGESFCLGAICLALSPSRTNEKLHCKGESYRFSGLQDLLAQIDRQTYLQNSYFHIKK